MPISYGDAAPLLSAITGPVVPTGVARRIADHVSHRPRARKGSSEDVFELGHEAAV